MSRTIITADPRYKRIRRQLEMQIRQEEWLPGARIPGERDLARDFGVSQMTVNRAIQELVLEGWLERRVGSGTYVRFRDVESMAQQEQTLVLVTPFTDHPEEDVYLSLPFRAISERITTTNGSLIVTQAPEERFPQVVDKHPGACFLFVAPAEEGYSALLDLYQQHVPFVVLGASWPDVPFACVDSDNAAGSKTAVEYLLHLGHERIGFVNGVHNTTNCRDRLEGYCAGMRERGKEPGDIVEADSNWELGEAARRQLTSMLLGREPVTAILCAGFYLTLQLLSLLRSLSLETPNDVSIITFDDPPSAAHLTPSLTALRQPLQAMGQRAAERTLALLEKAPDDPVGLERLPLDLILRASCGRRV